MNTGYYNKEPQEVSVINPDSQKIVKVLHLPGLYPGAAVGADDDLYISGGFSQKVYHYNKKFQAVRDYPVGGYVAGLAAIDAEHLAVVYLVTANSAEDFQKGSYLAGKLVILNTKTAQIERETTVGYFPQTVKYLNGKFYVTVTGENKLRIFDANLKPLSIIKVGAKPQNSCADGKRLYVVNQNSDDLSIIDTDTDRLISTLPVNWQSSKFGAAPTSCVIENKRLYVTEADVNAVAIYDLSADNRLLGYVPTGFFPTKVLFQNDKMLVVSAKGLQPRRPNAVSRSIRRRI